MGYGLVIILTFLHLVATTTSIALHRVTRARFVEILSDLGRAEPLERVWIVREQLAQVCAIIRTGCVLGLALLMHSFLENATTFDRIGAQSNWARYAAAFFLASLILLIVGVAMGNAWARYAGPDLLKAALPAVYITRAVLSPMLAVLQLGDGLVRRLAGAPRREGRSETDELEREILDAVTEGTLHGAVDEEEKDMIESVIELRDTEVAQIMTPRTDIVAIVKDTPLTEARDTIVREGHSRIPVYNESVDEILGILYAKDLLRLQDAETQRLTEVMRPALFIPETKPLKDLLREFRRGKVHIAIVLDEYGGTAGLVTIEDILEELVGEIADEYEPEQPASLRRLDADTAEVDARLSISEINSELDIELPESDNYETLGGFLFHEMGTVPPPGARFEHQNVQIQVLEAEPRRIRRVLIRIIRTVAVEEAIL